MKTTFANLLDNLFYNFWDKMLSLIGVLSVAAFSVFFFIAIFSDKPIRGYHLRGNDGNLKIIIDINWIPDEEIHLDRSITYDEAIEMVQKLNNTLK